MTGELNQAAADYCKGAKIMNFSKKNHESGRS